MTVRATPALLRFTARNWRAPKTVRVRAIDDEVQEGIVRPGDGLINTGRTLRHRGVIRHRVESGDPLYNGIAARPPGRADRTDLEALITDNDRASVQISSPRLELTEGGATRYSVRLGSAPSSLLQVYVHVPTAVSTYTPAGTLASGAGPARLIPDRAVLTFDALNWRVAQEVVLRSEDDELAQGTRLVSVRHTVAGAPEYVNRFFMPGVQPPGVEVVIRDNEAEAAPPTTWAEAGLPAVGVLIAPSALELAEGGTGEYSVVLTARPERVRSVLIDAVDPTQAEREQRNGRPAARSVRFDVGGMTSRDDARLEFTSRNWDVPQVVRISAVEDDWLDGGKEISLVHRLAVRRVEGEQTVGEVSVRISDNDRPGVRVDVAGLALTEGGDPVEVRLSLGSRPLGRAAFFFDADDQVSVSPDVWRLDPSDEETEIVLRVAAADDDVAEGRHTGTVRVRVSAPADPAYDGLAIAPARIRLTDNDAAGFRLDAREVVLVESARPSDSYAVSLTSRPRSNVAVSVEGGGPLEVSPRRLVFTPERWSVSQRVTVRVADDRDAQGHSRFRIRHRVETRDRTYARERLPSVVVSVTDDETAAVVAEPRETTVLEGREQDGTGRYAIHVLQPPDAPLTVRLLPDPQLVVSPEVIRIDPDARGRSPVTTVRVGARDNDVADGARQATVRHEVESADRRYRGFRVRDAIFTIRDDDSAGVRLSASAVDVAEGQGSGEYEVFLTSRPRADVRVRVEADEDQVRVEPAVLRFRARAWRQRRTVRVTAVDDRIDEGVPLTPDGRHRVPIGHVVESSDPVYDGIAVRAERLLPGSEFGARIADNDWAAVSLSARELAVDEGGAVRYSVRLASAPSGEVRVRVFVPTNVTVIVPQGRELTGARAHSRLSADRGELVFDNSNWRQPQEVALTCADDDVVQGMRLVRVSHEVRGAPEYEERCRGSRAPVVVVAIADNDEPPGAMPERWSRVGVPEVGVRIEPDALELAEGETGQYAVALTSRPERRRRIRILAIDPNQARRELRNRQFAPRGVRLNLPRPDDGCDGVLQFTPENWDVPQTVRVTAADDQWVDGGKRLWLVHSMLVGNWQEQQTVAQVQVRVADNDRAAVQVDAGGAQLAEGGEPRSLAVSLSHQPLGGYVVVDAESDGQLHLLDRRVVFDCRRRWEGARQLRVGAVDDAAAEGEHHGVVRLRVRASDDAAFDGLAVEPVRVSIADNDRPDPEAEAEEERAAARARVRVRVGPLRADARAVRLLVEPPDVAVASVAVFVDRRRVAERRAAAKADAIAAWRRGGIELLEPLRAGQKVHAVVELAGGGAVRSDKVVVGRPGGPPPEVSELTICGTPVAPGGEEITLTQADLVRGKVRIAGQAASRVDGVLLDRVEVSLDKGGTWRRAGGTVVWNYEFRPERNRTVQVLARAVARDGRVSPVDASEAIRVTYRQVSVSEIVRRALSGLVECYVREDLHGFLSFFDQENYRDRRGDITDLEDRVQADFDLCTNLMIRLTVRSIVPAGGRAMAVTSWRFTSDQHRAAAERDPNLDYPLRGQDAFYFSLARGQARIYEIRTRAGANALFGFTNPDEPEQVQFPGQSATRETTIRGNAVIPEQNGYDFSLGRDSGQRDMWLSPAAIEAGDVDVAFVDMGEENLDDVHAIPEPNEAPMIPTEGHVIGVRTREGNYAIFEIQRHFFNANQGRFEMHISWKYQPNGSRNF